MIIYALVYEIMDYLFTIIPLAIPALTDDHRLALGTPPDNVSDAPFNRASHMTSVSSYSDQHSA